MAELRTFVFTDIVGSVDLKNEMPGRSDTERDQAFIETILTPHRERIEQELDIHGGRVVSTAGDGHFLVFSDTILAARWAIAIQESHRDSPLTTPSGGRVAVRMSMHVGIPQIDPRDANNFVGKTVDYAARLNDYATGGQIIVSRSIVAILEDAGMDGVRFHMHGPRELKGIGQVEVHELIYEGQAARPMRNEPVEPYARQWTVLPATMGLTEFFGGQPPTLAKQGAATHHKLGNYELGEILGSGGMGNVYKARHSQFGRVRAVKVIKQMYVDAGHEEVVRRFYQEIKAVGALEHPNIVVAIESSAPTDPVHYLVMEYIDGVSVEDLVSRHGPLGVAEACEIGRQAAVGLDYIHQHGMVHRDVKPSNLMLTTVPGHALPSAGDSSVVGQTPARHPLVKILDLGLALLVGDDQQRLTQFDDRAMGTGMYMSPEQWRTTSVDIRADIYSLGCSLYHMLAGRPPFADSDLRPQRAHERAELPPIVHGAQPLPAGLWAILQRMTAKRPEDRFSSPAEVAAALAPYTAGNQLPALIDNYKKTPSGQTRPRVHSDTLITSDAEQETRIGRAAPHWDLTQASGAAPRWSTRRRVLTALGILVLFAATIWLAVQAGRGLGSARQTQAERLKSLQFAANTAAKGIHRQIQERFNILERHADDRVVRESVAALNRDLDDEDMWNRLGDWITARRAESPADIRSESWFINNRDGFQIARDPPSDSLGNNYSHRDYFHGEGHDYEQGSPEAEAAAPLESSHQSAVYRSTSTGHLKVAFSVPIWNSNLPVGEKRVLGVLAMSVDLGEFNVLEDTLPEGSDDEVVLIDLGEYLIGDQSGRGLVLHHQGREKPGVDDPLPTVSQALLAEIDEALEASANGRATLVDYRDQVVTGDRPYWGALTRVATRHDSTDQKRTGDWVVLVQQPARR